VRAEMMPFRALTAPANSLGETMLRIFGTLAAVVPFTTVARADCAGDCNRGYNGCKRPPAPPQRLSPGIDGA
jgi:hypothetical protein